MGRGWSVCSVTLTLHHLTLIGVNLRTKLTLPLGHVTLAGHWVTLTRSHLTLTRVTLTLIGRVALEQLLRGRRSVRCGRRYR